MIKKRYQPAAWEKKLAASTALFIVLLVSFVILRDRPPSPNQIVMLRILLSLSVAIIGAVIPGFLDVSLKGYNLAIRAGGALALFVITFFCTPTVLSEPKNITTPEPIQTSQSFSNPERKLP